MIRLPKGLRLALVAALACAAIVGTAAPAAAYLELQETGNHGTWNVKDTETKPGANCLYDSSDYGLNTISVRAPGAFGHHSGNQRIGWRFIIERGHVVNGDQFAWETKYTSTFQKDTVSGTEKAQFTRRAWQAPSNPTGQFRVRIVIRWYLPGGGQTVEGTVKLRYEWYADKFQQSSTPIHYRCFEDT